MGPGKSVYNIRGCSLIRGVHYERFHCTSQSQPYHCESPIIHQLAGAFCYQKSSKSPFCLNIRTAAWIRLCQAQASGDRSQASIRDTSDI